MSRRIWFPAPPGLGLEREIVLNQLFQRHTKLFPGDCHEGSLLGIGEGAIPEHYRDRQRFPTRVSIFDTRGNRYDLSVDLMVQRERPERCLAKGDRTYNEGCRTSGETLNPRLWAGKGFAKK